MGVAELKSKLYLRATIRQAVNEFGSPSSNSLSVIDVHTDRYGYISPILHICAGQRIKIPFNFMAVTTTRRRRGVRLNQQTIN